MEQLYPLGIKANPVLFEINKDSPRQCMNSLLEENLSYFSSLEEVVQKVFYKESLKAFMATHCADMIINTNFPLLREALKKAQNKLDKGGKILPPPQPNVCKCEELGEMMQDSDDKKQFEADHRAEIESCEKLYNKIKAQYKEASEAEKELIEEQRRIERLQCIEKRIRKAVANSGEMSVCVCVELNEKRKQSVDKSKFEEMHKQEIKICRLLGKKRTLIYEQADEDEKQELGEKWRKEVEDCEVEKHKGDNGSND